MVIILTGNLKSQFIVQSLSLVTRSRTNLLNKLLHGLTNTLLINRLALAWCTRFFALQGTGAVSLRVTKASPRVVLARVGCSRGLGGAILHTLNEL
jgi:hypothetical protein